MINHDQPAYALHAAVTHVDAAAEAVLRERFDIGYARFLLLVTVERLGPSTQRAIATELVLNEPTASRAIAAAQADGHLLVEKTPGAGNRRVVTLTDQGSQLLEESLTVLEEAFAVVLEMAGIDADEVLSLAGRILGVLAPASSAALTPEETS